MTNQEAFKLGFFAKCAEVGMTPEEVADHVKLAFDKQAVHPALAALAATGATAGGLAGGPLGALAALGIMAPPMVGYLGGSALANATDEQIDHKDFKKQEIINEYKKMTERLRLAKQQREMEEKLYG